MGHAEPEGREWGRLLAELLSPRANVGVDELDAVLGKPDRVGLPRRFVPGRAEERVWWRRGIAVTVTGEPAGELGAGSVTESAWCRSSCRRTCRAG
jgi:hypothetical protein